MRRPGLALAVVLAAGCGGAPDVPPPRPDRGQIVVHVLARKRTGTVPSDVAGPYGRPTAVPEAGEPYARVDYDRLKDIAVVLSAESLPPGGTAPEVQHLRLGRRFDRDLVLLAPQERTRLVISNDRTGAVTLFCCGDRDGFDVEIAAGATREVSLREAGLYELLCEQDESARTQLLVAPSSWAMMVPSGGWAVFDGLPPGVYGLSVVAPRLPSWRGEVRVAAGTRETREVTVTVSTLGGPRR